MSSKGSLDGQDQQGPKEQQINIIEREIMQDFKLSKHGVSSEPRELEESMSSKGSLDIDEQGPKEQQINIIEREIMQDFELSKHGVSQPRELEESPQVKSTNGLVPSVLVLVLGLLVLLLVSSMFPLCPPEALMMMVMVTVLLVLVLELVLSLKVYGNPRTNYTHMLGLLVLMLGLGLVVAVAALQRMFPLWRMLLVVLVLLVLLLTLERFVLGVMNLWRARGKWGTQWVLDSGAWIHHTSNALMVLEESNLQFIERGNTLVQLRLRSVRTERFEFPGVHYVVRDHDGDTRNVVSVSQLARDHGLVTVFEPMSCHIKNKKTGKIVGEGRLRNGMYMLDYLRVVSQCLGDGESSNGGEHGDGGGGGRDRGDGGQRNNGEGDSGMAEGREGGGWISRDGSGGGTEASRNQEQGGRSGAARGDSNNQEIMNEEEEEEEEEESSSENDIQEMNEEKIDEDDNGETHQELNGRGEDEDKKGGRGGGGSTFGESSNKGLLGLSRFVFVLCLCIAACVLLLLAGVVWKLATFSNLDFHSLHGFLFLFLSTLQLLRNLGMSTRRKIVKQIGSLFRGRSRHGEGKAGTTGDYVHESSHQEDNRRLFGLPRFDEDPTGYWRRQLPARAFASSINAPRREELFVDSGASFHTTWRESILFPYPQHLQNHTKPPTLSLGGIAAGSIAVQRSGYLNGDNIMLDGVLLALEAQANLVSVGQLSIQYGVQVEMDDEGVVIKRKRDGVRIGGGRMHEHHMYVLEYFLPGGLFAHGHRPNNPW